MFNSCQALPGTCSTKLDEVSEVSEAGSLSIEVDLRKTIDTQPTDQSAMSYRSSIIADRQTQ